MIKLKYKVEKSNLILFADNEAIEELKELPDRSIRSESEALEYLLSNSEFDSIDASDTGDLTDAPILGIAERNDTGEIIRVIERYAYMDYQVKSFIDDLIDTGKAIFVS